MMAGMSSPRRRADMFTDPQDDPREEGPNQADERTTLMAHLRWHRETLELKCSGLGPADLSRRSGERRPGAASRAGPAQEAPTRRGRRPEAEATFADQFVAQAPDLDVTGNDPWSGPVSLREVLVHMVEEYARHNGHADLLRERIDGRLGE